MHGHARGARWWGLDEAVLRGAWHDYQQGKSVARILVELNRRIMPYHWPMTHSQLVAEWARLRLGTEHGVWVKLFREQRDALTSRCRIHRLPPWVIMWAALRAAARSQFDPIAELMEAGVNEEQLRARQSAWADLPVRKDDRWGRRLELPEPGRVPERENRRDGNE